MSIFADQHFLVVWKKELHTWEVCGKRHREGVEMGSCDTTQLKRPWSTYPAHVLDPLRFSSARGRLLVPTPGTSIC